MPTKKIIMILTKENLQEWKAEVNRLMIPHGFKNGNWTDCLDDEKWLMDWEGETPEDCVAEEISNWEG